MVSNKLFVPAVFLRTILTRQSHKMIILNTCLYSRGFCYFNSVAIAARLLRLKLSVERVLIVDWVSALIVFCVGLLFI